MHFSGTDERTDRTTVEKTADKETKKTLSFVSSGDFVRDCVCTVRQRTAAEKTANFFCETYNCIFNYPFAMI